MSLSIKIKYSLRKRICEWLDIPYSIYDFPPPFVKHLPRQKPVNLIDVGAHDGWFTQRIDAYCGVNKAVLIEPLQEKYEQLALKFTGARFVNYNCVVSNTRQDCSFKVNELKGTSSLLDFHKSVSKLDSIPFTTEKIIQCKSRLLDDVFEDSGLDRVDILKIDVQGAEHLVLEGAKKTLSSTDLIWIEVSFKPLYENSSIFMDIHKILDDCGFMLLEIAPGYKSVKGELLQADALFKKCSIH